MFSLSGVQQRCATRSGVQQGGSLSRQRLRTHLLFSPYLPISCSLSVFALRVFCSFGALDSLCFRLCARIGSEIHILYRWKQLNVAEPWCNNSAIVMQLPVRILHCPPPVAGPFPPLACLHRSKVVLPFSAFIIHSMTTSSRSSSFHSS